MYRLVNYFFNTTLKTGVSDDFLVDVSVADILSNRCSTDRFVCHTDILKKFFRIKKILKNIYLYI